MPSDYLLSCFFTILMAGATTKPLHNGIESGEQTSFTTLGSCLSNSTVGMCIVSNFTGKPPPIRVNARPDKALNQSYCR
ncbi:hypothetical protein TNCV_1889461 [Trichonephila clavipes]|nr:hypothetical protein TNCV_1889461 [Trichonephila clavipes]